MADSDHEDPVAPGADADDPFAYRRDRPPIPEEMRSPRYLLGMPNERTVKTDEHFD